VGVRQLDIQVLDATGRRHDLAELLPPLIERLIATEKPGFVRRSPCLIGMIAGAGACRLSGFGTGVEAGTVMVNGKWAPGKHWHAWVRLSGDGAILDLALTTGGETVLAIATEAQRGARFVPLLRAAPGRPTMRTVLRHDAAIERARRWALEMPLAAP
jgi:hypothetical protein